MTGCSVALLGAWFVDVNYWEEEKDRDGKDRLRKVVRHESVYTILKMLLSKWPKFR